MSYRNEIITAIPCHASSEANKPLIPAGDAEQEEEDHRLEEKAFSTRKISALLLGLLVGFFIQFSIVGSRVLVITLSGEDLVIKSKANIVVFGLLWTFFTEATVIANLRFLRKLVTITYSSAVAGGCSTEMLEEMVWRVECRFLVGVYLAWTTTGALLGMRSQTEFSLVMLVVALVWCKIVMRCFALHRKPTSSRRSSSADEIVTAV
jgi:hypothetical protein